MRVPIGVLGGGVQRVRFRRGGGGVVFLWKVWEKGNGLGTVGAGMGPASQFARVCQTTLLN